MQSCINIIYPRFRGNVIQALMILKMSNDMETDNTAPVFRRVYTRAGLPRFRVGGNNGFLRVLRGGWSAARKSFRRSSERLI